MGSTALPALAIRPYEQPDLLHQAGQVMQLKNLMAGQQLIPGQLEQQKANLQATQQENQIRAQQLFDQQAQTAALKDWDGKSLDDLPGLLLKHNGSATAVFGMKNSILQQKTAMQKLDTDTLANQKMRNDFLLGKLKAATDGPDEGLAQRVTQAAAESVQAGYLDPQHAQALQQMTQQIQDPKALRDQLAITEKGFMGMGEQISQEQKNREIAAQEKTAGAHALTAETGAEKLKAQMNPQSSLYEPSAASVALGTAPGAAAIQKGEVQQAARKSAAEESAKLPIELKKAAAIQAMNQGDPNVAGKLLADRAMTISEMKVRGLTPQFQQQAIQAAQKIDPNFKAPEAEAQGHIAASAANQQFFGNTDSLLVKGGTLDQLEARGKALGTTQIPAYNSLANWTKAALGSGPQAAYAASVLGVADDYSKVMTGGQGSDTSRQQALDIISKNLSPEGRAAAVQQIREQVESQREGRIGTNPYMRDMYPHPNPGTSSGGQATVPAQHKPGGKAAGLTEGQTGTGSDGKKYVVKGGVWVPQ